MNFFHLQRLVLLILILSGCNPNQSNLSIETAGIFKPFSSKLENIDVGSQKVDLGEHVTTNGPKTLTLIISNNSDFPYTNLSLNFSAEENDQNTVTSFKSDETGGIAFPGFGGTCQTTIQPKSNCKIILSFSPRENKQYNELIDITFKNLVDIEKHTIAFTILAGTPPQLSLTIDKTQYTFGQLIGPAKTPVVEREELKTFTEVIEVKNTGGLSAKNVSVMILEECISSETNMCPANMNNAYIISTTCKSRILPNEKCSTTVTFTPKNQNPSTGPTPTDILEIDYKSNLNFSYKKTVDDDDYLNLNVYFRAVSTNIKAKFKSSAATISFADKITAGKRDVRTFRLSNMGFREGEIKGIIFRDSGSSLMGKCSKRNTNDILICYDTNNQQVSLNNLPFYIKDRNKCVPDSDLAVPKFIDVGEGCVFDLYFQPSVTYTSDKLTDFLNLKLDVLYDDKLKGLTNIVEDKFANLNAQSISPAKLEVLSVVYDATVYPLTPGEPSSVDLGRLAIQSLQFYKRKSLIVTFKNTGSTKANGVSFKDGKNTPIPVGGTTINLGTYTPYFYASVIGSESTCTVVAPGENCILSMNFAPISLSNTAKENENMYDGMIDATKRFKDFVVSYDNGSIYSDTNRSEISDIPKQSTTARIFSKIIRKGKLQALSDDIRNLSNINAGVNVIGDKYLLKFVLQNIGAGEIPYTRFINPPSPFYKPTPRSFDYDFKVVNSSPSDISSYNVTKDCKNNIDIDETYTIPSNANPGTRIGNFSALLEGESCLLTFEAKRNNRFYRSNSWGCNDSQGSDFEDGIRYFTQEALAMNPTSLWEPCRSPSNISMSNLQFDFYDGDTGNPASGVDPNYGVKTTLPNFNFNLNQSWQAKLIPFNPNPFIGATFYRPGYTMPMLNAGISSQTAKVITQQWFWGQDQSYIRGLGLDNNGSLYQGDKSRNFVPTMSAWSDRSNYDYVYFMGNFPQNSGSMVVPLNFKNHGGSNARIIQTSIVNLQGGLTQKTIPTVGTVVAPGGIISSYTFDLVTSSPGELKSELNILYETGEHLNTLEYNGTQTPTNINSPLSTRRLKILVLANIIPDNTFPKISISTQDYTVTENPGLAPSVVLNPTSYPQNLSWNISPTNSTIVFDTIKYPSNPVQVSDIYAQKKITFTNTSGFTITNFFIIYRDNTGSSIQRSFSNAGPLFTNVTPSAPGTCTSNMTLNNNQSCHVIVRYLPRGSDSTSNLVLSVLHKIGTGTFALQNLGISLMPRAPGSLIATGRTPKTINYKPTPTSSIITRSSFPLAMGTQQLDVIPKITKFDQVGTGTFRKIAISNQNSTKASMLLSYHLYLANNNLRGYSTLNKPPTSTVPLVTEYRTVDGHDYVIIHKNKYADNSDRIIVEASKGCLFGDDENNLSLSHNEKGFNNTTSISNPCLLLFTHRANFEYLIKSIAITNGDDMRENATELWYYSYSRSTSASIWLHAEGTFNPDTSILTGSYTNVTAFDSPQVNFNTPRLTESNPGVGDIVGLRIVLGKSSGVLNSPFDKTLTTYVDIRPYGSGEINSTPITFNTDLIPGEYRYFRVLAIRRHNLNNSSSKFLNLNAKEYLSLSSSGSSILKVLVPPLNHYYFHSQKTLVMKDLFDGITYDNFNNTKAKCSNASSIILKDPSALSYKYKLINKATWDLLNLFPDASSYENRDRIAHWIDDPLVNIDQLAGGDPNFTPNTSSQVLENSSIFYLRNSSNPSALVNQAIGGVSGANLSNWNSYVDGNTGYASARCMVVLP